MDPLEVIRKRLEGKTQKELAGELGISVQYLNDILAGRRSPGPTVIEALGLEKQVTYRKANA